MNSTVYKVGCFTARINGKCRDVWGNSIDPTLIITLNTGKTIFDYTDVHFSQAKSVSTLKRRLDCFAEHVGHKVQKQ